MESPLGRLKNHILVLFGSEDVRRLVSVFWLWRLVLLPLCRELLFSLLQLSIRRRRVSLLLVRDLCWSVHFPGEEDFGHGAPFSAYKTPPCRAHRVPS